MNAEVAEPERRPALPRRALDAAAARKAELRHAVRVSVAVGASFAIGALLHLPQAYWAVFTAVIVVQTSIGGTITASIERLFGTVVGGVVGVAAAYLRARTVLEEGLILSASIALLAFAAAVWPSLRVAPITAAIVLVGGPGVRMDPLLAALWRVAEISIGSVVGVLATLLVFPARARRTVISRVAVTMEQLAGLIRLYALDLEDRGDEQAIHRAHEANRKSLAQVEQALNEAARESASGLRGLAIPEGLLRSLWRVRNDAVMVGRALAQPLPPSVAELLGPCAATLIEAMAGELEHCAASLRAGRTVVDGRLAQPRAAFQEGAERVRQARLTAGMSFDVAARVFGLVFALESLIANLADLADRVDEMTGTSRTAKA